jgi:hypothetical protein
MHANTYITFGKYFEVLVQNKTLASLIEEFKNEIESEKLENKSYSLMPTNISVMPESLPTGHLYLSTILSNGSAISTRDSTDELFPFQLDRQYQQIQFVPGYRDCDSNENLTIYNLIVESCALSLSHPLNKWIETFYKLCSMNSIRYPH